MKLSLDQKPMFPEFPQVGGMFQEKYLITEKIGHGGFAHVYRASSPLLRRDVAIKYLPSNVTSANARERFQREAQILASLRSEYTPRIHDFGEVGSGSLYMVCEFVDGSSLKDVIAKDHPIDPIRALEITRRILNGLDDTHDLGFVHRDVKPTNVLIYNDRRSTDGVKLIDFGIAKQVDRDQQVNLTRKNHAIGTPRYMAPEQIVGEAPMLVSDIYSTGLVLAEMLCGQPLIQSAEQSDIISAQLSPTPLLLPVTLDRMPIMKSLVQQMVEKDHRKRIQTAFDCVQEIDAILTRQRNHLIAPPTMKLSKDQLDNIFKHRRTEGENDD